MDKLLSKQKQLDPRIIRTRRDLAASMCTLMRQKPFSQISVQAIAENALINRATFYAHFEDKYSLLEYMVRGSFQEKLEDKIKTCDRLSAEHLHSLMLATCEFLGEFDDKYSSRPSNDHAPIEGQLQPHLSEILLTWANASGIDSAETIATTISWAIFGSALDWSRGDRQISAEALTTRTLAMLTRGCDLYC